MFYITTLVIFFQVYPRYNYNSALPLLEVILLLYWLTRYFYWLIVIGDNCRTSFHAMSVHNFFKILLNHAGHTISQGSILSKSYHLWCWLIISLSFNNVIIILSLNWTNEFPCGMTIPYLAYWISMLRCNRFIIDVWSFDWYISVIFTPKTPFPILSQYLARLR